MRFNSFFEMISYCAKTQPDAPALKYDGTCWSYAQLLDEVSARAEKFRASGRTCLAVLSDGSAECVFNIFDQIICIFKAA